MRLPQIPGYRLVSRLGSGASGSVYRAVQLGLSREVALKVLTPGLFDQEETRARFLREAKLQARLTHANLVQVFDAGVAGGRPYLVTELVGGGTLRSLLESRRPAVSEAVRLGRQVAAGLAHAHGAGIVHRDLKPENVLLTVEGVAKVADFGLAKAPGEGQTLETAEGRIMGTPGYLAPELFSGGAAGPAADLYALGVLLFELLAGRQPYSGADGAELIANSLRGPQATLRGHRPDLPEPLRRTVDACLARDPSARPASAALLAAELAAFEDLPDLADPTRSTRPLEETSRPTAAGPSKAARAGSRAGRSGQLAETVAAAGPAAAVGTRRRWPWMACALAGLLAVALGLAVRSRPAPPPPPGGLNLAVEPAPITASQPALPKVTTITVSATSARVWLERAAPAGLRLSCERAKSQQQTTFDVKTGARSHLISGLSSGTSYRARLELGTLVKRFQFRTLHRESLWQATLLDVDCTHTKWLAMTRARDRIGVCWHREDGEESQARGQLRMRESFDDGETWTHAQTVFGPVDDKLETLSMASNDTGWVVATQTYGQGPQTFRVFRRTWEPGPWHELARVPMPRSGIAAVATGDDGGLHVLFKGRTEVLVGKPEEDGGSPESAARGAPPVARAAPLPTLPLRGRAGVGGARAGLLPLAVRAGVEHRPATPGERLRADMHCYRWPAGVVPVPPGFPPGDAIPLAVDWLGLGRGRWLVVAHAPVPPDWSRRPLMVGVADSRSLTNPTTIVPLTPLAGDSVVDWALAATPDRVVVAVQGQNGTLWTALSRDGVRFTPLAQMPLPPGTEGRRPALCSDGDSVYLAFQTWDLEMSLRAMSMHFYVNRSLESGWTKVASRPVAIPDLYALELTVCGKKLLAVGTDWTGPIQMVTVER